MKVWFQNRRAKWRKREKAMGRETSSFIHGDQQGLPDFSVHAQLGLPHLPPDPFWPGAALGFGPMFGLGGLPPSAAAALGLPWSPALMGGNGKTPPVTTPPSFHTFLSQYVLAGGGLPIPAGLGLGGLGAAFALPTQHPPQTQPVTPPPLDLESSNPTRPPSRSPPTPSPPSSSSPSETRKNSIEALRLRAKEHQALILGQQHPRLGVAATPASPTKSASQRQVQAKS